MTDEVEENSIRSELQDLVLESAQIEEFLDGMVKIAARELGEISGRTMYAAVTLLRPKRAATVASSSPEARNMDEVQFAFDDGPCLRAAREHYTVVVQDFHAEQRFGEYTAAVAGHGLRSALGVPILLEGEANAGLDLYCLEPDAFSAESIDAAEQFARRASHSLQIAVRVATLMENSQHMSAAMENRTTIDLAVGIIMGQNRCSQDEAVNILKAASSARNVKLQAVAAAVVESVNNASAATHFDA
ncbi:GAF and ANTAR domain-containing protein [Arthrobacter tumbae]|uniref:GAF and ANTAR domain-containing protein n=1 Tax=Arthrobacter tumbae TaxID=163874 RepID=UPI0027DCA77A|nr:GAF and ANTAR domain-containing protein [Arthrobacter tumbae]MBM7782337.1 GAF domain-containing protein [Arthrobacter tumbae]